MSSESSDKILEEMIEMSVGIIGLLDDMVLPRSVNDQLIRSATSIGANFAEAQDASSKKDFLNRIYIAKKEASETVYWLKLVAKLRGGSEELIAFQTKVQGYLMMLQKIINTSRGSK